MEKSTDETKKEIYNNFSKEIIQRVQRNLKNVDKEGFAFLTNTKKGLEPPKDFAKAYGIVRPSFILKKAYDRYGNELTTHESWWVRDESKYKE